MAKLRELTTPEQIADFDKRYRMVRVKPYNQAKGHLVRRLNMGGHMFEAGVWKQVTIDQAEALLEERQNPNDINSQSVFDSYTYGEYRRVDLLEQKKRLNIATEGELNELLGHTVVEVDLAPRAPVSFSDVKTIDAIEPRGAAVRPNGGDLSLAEVKAGETRPGPQPRTAKKGKSQPQAAAKQG